MLQCIPFLPITCVRRHSVPSLYYDLDQQQVASSPTAVPSRTTGFDNVYPKRSCLAFYACLLRASCPWTSFTMSGTTLFGLLAGDRIDTHSTKQQCSVHCKRRIPSIGRDHLFIIFFNIEIRFLFLFTADTFYLQDLV